MVSQSIHREGEEDVNFYVERKKEGQSFWWVLITLIFFVHPYICRKVYKATVQPHLCVIYNKIRIIAYQCKDLSGVPGIGKTVSFLEVVRQLENEYEKVQYFYQF